MSVVNTQQLLYKISNFTSEEVAEFQREIICKPLKILFPNESKDALHYELLRNGLFDPDECMDLAKIVKELEKKEIWKIVQDEYERLQSLWNGPEVPIYIYPLTKHRPTFEGIEVKKNGVTYKGVVFLFVSTELVEKEIKAMFAHEYHHICRLGFLNKEPQEMLLKDSLVIEGMAECAVEELYGDKWLSPWTKRYTFEEVVVIWREHFLPVLDIRDVKNHQSFLYGEDRVGLPSWIGYSIGYNLVKSYLKNHGPLNQQTLYRTPTDIIVEGSELLP